MKVQQYKEHAYQFRVHMPLHHFPFEMIEIGGQLGIGILRHTIRCGRTQVPVRIDELESLILFGLLGLQLLEIIL